MEERRLGLSRRRFTREFKITAVRRLQQGESVAVLARTLEVNPGLLHRWREEFRHEPGKAFPGSGRSRIVWRNWNARSVSRRWRLIF